MESVQSGLITVNKDGSVSIVISNDGYPGGEAIVPAPFKTEVEIEAQVGEAKKAFYLQGYYIQSTRRVRNEVFDKPNEMTSTKIVFRACKNNSEATYVMGQFKRLVDERGPNG